MTARICIACQSTFSIRGPGHYVCDECRTDDTTETRKAEEALNTGGLTITPLKNPSGVSKGTSGYRNVETANTNVL